MIFPPRPAIIRKVMFMRINRPMLKAEAKNCMRASKTNPYLTALLYFIACFIITRLISRLVFPSDLIHYVIDFNSYEVRLYISPEYYGRILVEPFAYILSLLLEVSRLLLDAGLVIFCLRAANRAENSVWNLIDGFPLVLRLIGLYIVEGIFVFLWSLLFIIPGIIASYRYRLAIYLLIERPELGIMDCIRESKRLMAGRKGELFVLDLSFIGWRILELIPLVSVYVAPYTATTYACYYLAVSSSDSRAY